MVSNDKKQEIKSYLFVTALILFFASNLVLNLEYFYIDNPSILVSVKEGTNTLKQAILNNPRLDFGYNILIYVFGNIFGNYPMVYYLLQLCFFALTLYLIIFLIHCMKLDTKESCIIVVFAFIGSTMAENLYTVGKKEVFLTQSLVLCIVSLYKLIIAREKKKRFVLLYFIGLLFAITLKETSIVIVVTILLMEIFVLFAKNETKKEISIVCFGTILLLIGVKAYQKIFTINSAYTNYEITFSTIINSFMYYCRYHIDIIIFGVSGLAVGLTKFFKNHLDGNNVFFLIINLTGWSYMGGICMWRWTQSYYIYPTMIFFDIAFINVLMWVRDKGLPWKACLLSICILGGSYGLLYNYCVASAHIDAGKIFTYCVNYLNSNVDGGNRIIFADYNLYEEQPYQAQNILGKYLENDFEIYGGRQNITQEQVSGDILALYGYTEEQYIEEKEKAEIQVGDYIVHYTDERSFYGPIRAINPASSFEVGALLDAQGHQIELLSENCIERKYIGIKSEEFGLKKMYSGYQIWKVIGEKEKIVGLSSDGWTGKELNILNYEKGDGKRIEIRDIGTAINGYQDNTFLLYINSEYVDRIIIQNGNSIYIDDFLQEGIGKCNISLLVDKTFIPSECDEKYSDFRELGINVAIY